MVKEKGKILIYLREKTNKNSISDTLNLFKLIYM